MKTNQSQTVEVINNSLQAFAFDTFIIRGGKIVKQTFAAVINQKHKTL